MAQGTTFFPTGIDTQLRDRKRTERKSSTYTVVVVTDNAKTFVSNVQTTYTLHATAPGSVYTFVYDGKDAAAGITISPNASDGIAGAGVATSTDKDLILTAANAKRGDYVVLTSGAGATGATAWHVSAQRGVWTKEA